MLRIARTAVSRPVSQPLRRLNHGVAYGPAEPLAPYIKWILAIGSFVGLVTYDRFLSDGAITKLVTPTPSPERDAQIVNEHFDFLEKQWKTQEKAIVLFAPDRRTTQFKNFRANPVPEAPYRSAHTGTTLDLNAIGERRPRSKVLVDQKADEKRTD